MNYSKDERKDKMDISLDYNFLMAPVIGKQHGLEPEEIMLNMPMLEAAYQGVHRAYQAGKLTWIDLPKAAKTADEIISYSQAVRSRFENFVVLGIGGSALGNIALQTALSHPFYNLIPSVEREGPRIFVLDNVDPVLIAGLLDVIDISKTCFNVISKSGETAETMAQFLLFRHELRRLAGEAYNEHIVATTSSDRGYLKKIADEENYRTFIIPEGVGGRFSVLSPVGLLSAAVAGIDITRLLAGAQTALQASFDNMDLHNNMAAMNALLQFLFYQKGKHISVMMPYSHQLMHVADWYRQLWAESLGKKFNLDGKIINAGPTPIKAVGATDQHSQVQLYIEGPYDKVITLMQVENFAENSMIPEGYQEMSGFGYLSGHSFNELIKDETEATALALAEASRPNCTIHLPEINAATIGQLLMTLELQTAYSGELYQINAFDQPGVEFGKINTYALMGRTGFEKRKEEIDQAMAAKQPSFVIN